MLQGAGPDPGGCVLAGKAAGCGDTPAPWLSTVQGRLNSQRKPMNKSFSLYFHSILEEEGRQQAGTENS